MEWAMSALINFSPAPRARMTLHSRAEQNSKGFLYFFLFSVQTKLTSLTPEFHLTKDRKIRVRVADDVYRDPLRVDLDDKWFCCSFLRNNYGSCFRFVLILYLFAYVILQLMQTLTTYANAGKHALTKEGTGFFRKGVLHHAQCCFRPLIRVPHRLLDPKIMAVQARPQKFHSSYW